MHIQSEHLHCSAVWKQYISTYIAVLLGTVTSGISQNILMFHCGGPIEGCYDNDEQSFK